MCVLIYLLLEPCIRHCPEGGDTSIDHRYIVIYHQWCVLGPGAVLVLLQAILPLYSGKQRRASSK